MENPRQDGSFLRLVECPRDAMQGIEEAIPTERKVRYLNKLLRVGFHTLDMGSFVSPKAIPQMADTADVLDRLDPDPHGTRLLVIVANERGAQDAASVDRVDDLGYPFSVSETFQRRNTNASIEESLDRVKAIRDIAGVADKRLVVYLSMGFGNPYGDPYSPELVEDWSARLHDLGITILSLSDTVGVAKPETIEYLFSRLIPALPDVEFGAHFHTAPHNWKEKIRTAYEHGCRRFDAALLGYGGCPMARDELIGNMPTEHFISYFDPENIGHGLDVEALEEAMREALNIFGPSRFRTPLF